MATTRHARNPSTTKTADPIARAREVVASKPRRRLTGRAHKQKREIIVAILEEHVSFLTDSVPLGDLDRAMLSVGRLRTLIGELKALEGWTWDYPDITDPEREYRRKAEAFITAYEAAGGYVVLEPARPATLHTSDKLNTPGHTVSDPERLAELKQTLQGDPDLKLAVRMVLHERSIAA